MPIIVETVTKHGYMYHGYDVTLLSLIIPVNTKHLYKNCTMLDQPRKRWTAVVQVLYKCFVFAGMLIIPLLQNISENLSILQSSISDILCCDVNDSTAVKYI